MRRPGGPIEGQGLRKRDKAFRGNRIYDSVFLLGGILSETPACRTIRRQAQSESRLEKAAKLQNRTLKPLIIFNSIPKSNASKRGEERLQRREMLRPGWRNEAGGFRALLGEERLVVCEPFDG